MVEELLCVVETTLAEGSLGQAAQGVASFLGVRPVQGALVVGELFEAVAGLDVVAAVEEGPGEGLMDADGLGVEISRGILQQVEDAPEEVFRRGSSRLGVQEQDSSHLDEGVTLRQQDLGHFEQVVEEVAEQILPPGAAESRHQVAYVGQELEVLFAKEDAEKTECMVETFKGFVEHGH